MEFNPLNHTIGMLNRKILEHLELWAKNPYRKPLVLRGARQVGKTTAVKMFSQSFEQFIELNLDISEDRKIFDQGLNIKDLYQAILLRSNKVNAKSTLLFIDEIQHSPNAMNSLRYFYEEFPELHVIAAGSLLEVMLDRASFDFPVGRVEFLWMYPLDFSEYLQALGNRMINDTFNTIPLPAYAADPLFAHFHKYALIGGYPEVLFKYIQNNDIVALNSVYESLRTSYFDDIKKYAKNETMSNILRHCLESVPLETGRRINFAGFGQSHYRTREVSEALRTLQMAMLIYLFYPITKTTLPIYPDKKKHPRLQYVDIGLLNYFGRLQEHYFSIKDLNTLEKGRLAEQIVGQELLAQTCDRFEKPVMWIREKRPSSAEVDFIIAWEGKLIPIEVKSGSSGHMKSLHQYMDNVDHGYAVRLYGGPLKVDNCITARGKPFKLLNLPHFLTSKIPEYLNWAF